MSVRALESARVDIAASAHSRRLRIYAWAVLPILASAYYALLMLPIAPIPRLVLLEIVYSTPIVLTVLWSWRAHTLSEGAEKVFWAALAIANAVLFSCEALLLTWVVAIDPAGPPRVSWPFHVLHGIAAVSFIIAISALSRLGQGTIASKVRWSIDLASVSLLVGVLLLEAYVRPVMEPAGATVPEVLLGVGYPLFGLMMISGTLGNLVGFKVDRWRSWDKLVAISMIIYAVAISLWPIWFTTAAETSRNYERGILDLVQFSGHWLLMAASVYRLTEVREWHLRPLPMLDAARHRWANAAVPAIILLGIPVVAVLATRTADRSEWLVVYVVAFTVLTAFALGRGTLIALENGVLFHRSITDPLTGLHNRRYFFDRLAEELERAKRYGDELTVIALDIDDFAGVNVRLGHDAGERLLQSIGALLRSRVDGRCLVARLQGDDFAVIAPATGPLEGSVIARRLIDTVSIGAGDPGTVTVSAGVASFPRHASDGNDLMRIVRGALYHAKQSGREGLVAYEDHRVVDLSAQERIERLERQNRLSSVRALSAAMNARDPAIYRHARHVASLSAQAARFLGLSEETIGRTETVALLHDVGVLGCNEQQHDMASGMADCRERREHGATGQKILASSGLGDLLPIMRAHYERWDGTGYPDGLRGEEIPLEARILAVCDAFDTMTSDRPQRMALSRRQARAELHSHSGHQFDPSAVAALFAVLDAGASSD